MGDARRRLQSVGNGSGPVGANGEGSLLQGGVLLGREFRITLDKEHRAVLEQVARFNGMSPNDWATHALKWATEKAHYEIACAIAVQTFLQRGFVC